MKTKLLSLTAMFLLFCSIVTLASVPERRGWWKFDDAGDMLKAEIGSALALTGTQTSVAGPAAGNLATEISVGSFLTMTHGIPANGGGSMVNEYSLQLDLMMPVADLWHSLLQTDPANGSDGDLFLNGSNHIGASRFGYSDSAFEAASWYRVIVSVKNGTFYKIYVNGELWVESTGMDIDSRDALAATLLLFADEDGEDNTMVCAEVAIWDVALSANEALELGNASTLPIAERKGWWKFDDAGDMLKAETGNALTLTGTQTSVPGPEDGNLATEISVGSYLAMAHGITANGGGTMVNEYSLQLDLMMPVADMWHSLLQTDPANGTDGDLFLNGSNHIGASRFGYSDNAFAEGIWHRVVVTVKNGTFYKIYVNGEIWLDAAGMDIDSRDALDATLLLFADEDSEDNTMQCAEAAIWDVALTADEVFRLGGFASSIPVSEITVTGTGGATTIETNGGTLLMLAQVLPENATNKVVEWSVENGTGEAIISTDGHLTAVKNGTVTVKATSTDGSDISGSLEITISNQAVIPVSSITVSSQSGASSITNKGGTLQMIATVLPENATDKNVTWAVENGSGEASISSAGVLTAVADGLVTVKATSVDGSNIVGNMEITISNQSASTVRKGWWTFDDELDIWAANLGEPLVLSGSYTSVSGPTEGNIAVEIGLGSYLEMTHGIPANGGGDSVNEYTLFVDFNIPQVDSWHSIYQLPDNADDAEMFINTSNKIGAWRYGYSENVIEANKWYRLMVTVKNGDFFKIYLNGELWVNDTTGQPVDGRDALTDKVLMFADNDGEDNTIICSEIAIWDVALSAAEVLGYGDPTTGFFEKEADKYSALGQNFPNPANDRTIFPYTVDVTANVNFKVMDMTGKVVASFNQGSKTKGNYTFELDVNNFSAGIYYVMLEMDGKVSTRKISVTK